MIEDAGLVHVTSDVSTAIKEALALGGLEAAMRGSKADA